MLCRLFVDHRENKVHRWLDIWEEKKIDYELKQLPIGDYIITTMDHRPLAIVERKTYEDFYSSIIDGRINNREKMYAFRDKYRCRVVLLVEGEANPPNRPELKNLHACIDHMIMRDNVHVVYTGSRGDDGEKLSKKTAKYLARYCQNITTLMRGNKDFCQNLSKIPQMDGEDFNPRKVVDDIEDLVIKMWCALPKIGPTTARKLIQKTTVAKHIRENNLSLTHIETMFSKIRGISKSKASEIVKYILLQEQGSFDTVDAKKLSEIKINNRKLGNVVSKRVHDCLHYIGGK